MKSGMKISQQLFVTAFLLVSCVIICGCDYGRMRDQDVIKTFKKEMPPMDKRTIPVNDGYELLANTDPQKLRNPLAPSSQSVTTGRTAYGYYCIQCHGDRLDGHGTVGQSFSPLPTDLTSSTVLSQSDGMIYSRIRLGFKRHPALFPTVSSDDTWAVIVYMRSLKGRS